MFDFRKSPIRFGIGIIILLISIFSKNILLLLGYGLPWTIGQYQEMSQIKLMHATIEPVKELPKPIITIGRPESMQENQSTSISLKFEWKSDTPIISPISAKLVSTSFRVEPKDSRKQELVDVGPTFFNWVVTPNAQGSHNLQIDIQYDIEIADPKKGYVKKNILESETIDIKVVTIWGVSKLTYDMVHLLFVAISLILMSPWLYKVFRAIKQGNSKEAINNNNTA